jgi:hypothetical protein
MATSFRVKIWEGTFLVAVSPWPWGSRMRHKNKNQDGEEKREHRNKSNQLSMSGFSKAVNFAIRSQDQREIIASSDLNHLLGG